MDIVYVENNFIVCLYTLIQRFNSMPKYNNDATNRLTEVMQFS